MHMHVATVNLTDSVSILIWILSGYEAHEMICISGAVYSVYLLNDLSLALR